MAHVPIFHGRISADGERLILDASEAPAREMHRRSLAGQRIDMTLRPHKDRRSEQANAYYWACVLTRMSEESEGDQSPEEIHDAMCAMFLPNEPKRVAFFNRMTGETLAIDTDPRRSSKLKGDEFYTFVEKVRKFALEFLHVATEDPDPEYWRHRKAA